MKIPIKIKLFFFCACQVYISYAQNNNADSLINILKTAKQDTNKIVLLNRLSIIFISSEPDKAIDYAQQTLLLSEQLNWKKGMGMAYHAIGYFHISQADYPKTLDYWQKALKIYQELKDKYGIAKTLGNLGIVYAEQADYPKALDYYLRALKLKEELGLRNETAFTLSNIGLIYDDQSDYSKALDYYFKALDIARQLGNNESQADFLGKIGGIYLSQATTEENTKEKKALLIKGLDTYAMALKKARELGNKPLEGRHLGNIAIILVEQTALTGSDSEKKDLFSKALDNYLETMKISEEIGDNRSTAINYANIATLYLKMGSVDKKNSNHNYNNARECLEKGLVISKSLGILEVTGSIEEIFFMLDTVTGNYRSGFAHYKNHIAVKDSISNNENLENQTRVEMQFLFDKKQIADSIRVSEERKVRVAELKVEKNKSYSLFGGLGLVVLVALFTYNRYRVSKKQKKIIEEQKKVVEEQTKIVEERNKEVMDSIYYAKRIQTSLLPSEKYIAKVLRK